jgi:hypothetical protein
VRGLRPLRSLPGRRFYQERPSLAELFKIILQHKPFNYAGKFLLPGLKVTEVTTMCGHGLVSFNLVQFLVKEIRRGEKTLKEAAETLARPCVCGVVNPRQTVELLRAML